MLQHVDKLRPALKSGCLKNEGVHQNCGHVMYNYSIMQDLEVTKIQSMFFSDNKH